MKPRKCAWPKSCEEVADVPIGMLWFCQDHAIEVDKNLHGTLNAEGKHVPGIIEVHQQHKPDLRRQALWVRLQEQQARELEALIAQGLAKKKKDDVNVEMFREGLARHDRWRAEQSALPQQESKV